MTELKSPVRRLSRSSLDGSFGPDCGRRLVVSLVPGAVDVVEIRPAGTRRAETLALVDLYRIAVRSRVNAGVLVRAREKKAKKAERLARARIARADMRMSELCGPRWGTL